MDVPSYRKALQIVLAGLFTIVLNCSEDNPAVSEGETNGDMLKIVFTWSGDDMASRQELETRDRIARRISAEGIGKIVRAGTGMGWMDLVVAVEDADGARRQIEQIIRELSPEARFSIRKAGS